MKKEWILLSVVWVIFCMTGCRTSQNLIEKLPLQTDETREISIEREDSFVLAFNGEKTDMVISLEDCTCEYNHDKVQIYSKLVTPYDWTSSTGFFKSAQYVLYIQTPYETVQIFPVKDFLINQEREILYMLREDYFFKSIEEISDFRWKEGSAVSSKRILLERAQLEEIIEDSGMSLSVAFTAFEQKNGKDILKGEASGINGLTGKKQYVDFEWDEASGRGEVFPCVLRIYNPLKDKEEFEKCGEAYDRIEKGDLSMVTSESSAFEIDADDNWRRADINRDGMPELILQNGNGDRTEHKKPISLVLAWQDDRVEAVYTDTTNAMEFLYLSDNGLLMCENTVLGNPQDSEFIKYYFDEKWNPVLEESLRLLYFQDEEAYSEEDLYSLRRAYPDTFGTYGGGLYYVHYSSESEENLLTCREFLDSYEKMTGQDFLDDHAFYWAFRFEEALTDEHFYEYEIKEDDFGNPYAAITGIAEKYRDDLNKNLQKLTMVSGNLVFPETLEGVAIKELAPYAFQNMNFGYTSLLLPPGIEIIGEHCFEHCSLTDVTFLKKSSNMENALIIGDRAFADNENLWGVYLNDADTILGREVFTGCSAKVYLCYPQTSAGAEEMLMTYAWENALEAVEIPLYESSKPIVNYPETPLVLMPEIGNFFYGDSAEGDDFCSFEYDDNAPDFGFPEKELPCGELCATGEYCEITASSSLASRDGRYAPWNVAYGGREATWAEGADGYGIGESISITQCAGYEGIWDGFLYFYPGDIEPDVCDGYMRYTEICIVNGYAKNQQTFEENGRIKRLLMYVENTPYAYLELEDTIRPQYFKLPINDIKAASGVDTHFQFVIEEVYPGSKYEDTCLTGLEIEYMGRWGH